MNLREQREAQLAAIEERIEAATWQAMQAWLDDAATAALRDGLVAAAGDQPDPGALTGAAAAWQKVVGSRIVTAIGDVLGEVFAGILGTAGVISARPWQENYLAQVPNRLKNIPDRAFEVVRDEVQAAIDEGQSIADMRDRVATVLSAQQGGSENSWKKRATLIARTEASGAYNGGMVAAWAYRDSLTSQPTDKVWVATMDPRCRASHFAADGQRVPLDGEFLVGGHRMAHPGDHRAPISETANCRCTVIDVPHGEPTPFVGDRQLSGGRASTEVLRRAAAGEFRDGDGGLTAAPASVTALSPAAAAAGATSIIEESHVARSTTTRPGMATAAPLRKYTQKRDGDGDGILDETSKVQAGAPRVKSAKADRASTYVGDEGNIPIPDATDQQLLEEADGRLSRFNMYQDPTTRQDVEHLADELEDRGLSEKSEALRAQIDDQLAGGEDDEDNEDGAYGDPDPLGSAAGQGTTADGTPLYDLTDDELRAEAQGRVNGGDMDETVPGTTEQLDALQRELESRGLLEDAADVHMKRARNAYFDQAIAARDSAGGDDEDNEDGAYGDPDPLGAAAEQSALPDGTPFYDATDAELEAEVEARTTGGDMDETNPETKQYLDALESELQERGLTEAAADLRLKRNRNSMFDEAAARAALVADAAIAVEGAAAGARTWEGTLAPIGVNSGDRRRFKAGGTFTHRPLPLPLMFQERTADGHDTATVVGRILTIEERDGEFWGTGDYLDGPEFAEAVGKAIALSKAKMGHVSVDLADVVAEVVGADGAALDEQRLFEIQASGDGSSLFEQYAEATIIGATQVAKPAFAEAIIALSNEGAQGSLDGAELAVETGELAPGDKVSVAMDDDQGETMEYIDGTVVSVDEATGMVTVQPDQADAETLTVPVAQVTKSGPVRPELETTELSVVAEAERVLARAAEQLRSLQAAAGQVEELWRPDPEVFADPQLKGLTPMTIGPDGRVFGHIAAWGQCHVGFAKCTTPPDEDSFDYFHIGEVELSDGSALAIGNLTLGGRHADVKLAYRDAIAHYDVAGAGVAVVRAYKDEFGIAVAGCLTPETTPQQKAQLRRCGLSGDWRRIGARMRLSGALAVNSGGFPVPRHAVDAQGRQLGLVAAGMVPVEEPTEETYEQVARRVFAEETQKAERRAQIRAMALTATAAANRDELGRMLSLVASADARKAQLAGLLAGVSV